MKFEIAVLATRLHQICDVFVFVLFLVLDFAVDCAAVKICWNQLCDQVIYLLNGRFLLELDYIFQVS